MTISNIKVEVLPVHECAMYLGQTINISATRHDRKSGAESEQLGRRSADTSKS